VTIANERLASLSHTDRFFIGGEWVQPSSDATIDVTDSATEELYFQVAEAQADDIARAVAAARTAFDEGPWPKMSHAERAEYLRGFAAGLQERSEDVGQMWPRESGVIHAIARHAAGGSAQTFDYYAGLADTFAFEEPAKPSAGNFGLLVREPCWPAARSSSSPRPKPPARAT
jgi:acyl-CoA reductase-like NAD-dependent aldehyde dehydrogenase